MIKKNCPHYPCHTKSELESCYYCYCPIFPCYDRSKGGFEVVQTIRGEKISTWNCMKCTFVHKLENVEKIKQTCKEQIFPVVKEKKINKKNNRHLKLG